MKNGIGEIQTQFQVIGNGEPFRFAAGGEIAAPTISYETYGSLNAEKSNAILLFHALSGSQHAAGYNPGDGDKPSPCWTEECHTGWWDAFIGPGRALDTDRFFVICANYLGGCYGSTGPASPDPATGKPYGPAFPHVGIRDVVRSQAMLLDALGIGRLHAVIGPSTGGLACLNFATTFPERVRFVVPVATGIRTTVLNRIILLEQILAIENDPHFRGGDYYDGPAPQLGLTLARMISHKCFVHLDAIERRARRDVVQPEDHFTWYSVADQVESYMLHQGKKFVSRFDANTYLRICEMWSRFDPVREGDAEDLTDLFSRSAEHGHRYLVFSIDEDYCFYPEEQAALVRALKRAGVSAMHITVHSDKGHDSFLLEPELYTPHIDHLLKSGL
ncbi:MAG: homoserine O-acetyltransferase [Akkermansiaceae bacterium]|nr:homoserine O-acetyltransferase [Akkermansiaceae bacterium]MCP5551611.1 homoserine O-acetyltransferase [Akkermansiaceae bacterium]